MIAIVRNDILIHPNYIKKLKLTTRNFFSKFNATRDYKYDLSVRLQGLCFNRGFGIGTKENKF